MGQYHLTVNLDKRQYLRPHKLGDGLKLLEQAGASGGVTDALFLLLAVSNGRGGGDVHTFRPGPDKDNPYTDGSYDTPEIVGAWGGDRIAVIGDYAEDTDLAPEHRASLIYEQISVAETMRDGSDAEYVEGMRTAWYDVPGYSKDGLSKAQRYNMSWDEFVTEAKRWRDISDDIVPVLEKHLNVKLVGRKEGWRTRVTLCWHHEDKVKGHAGCGKLPTMSGDDLGMYVRMGVPPEMLGIDEAQAKAIALIPRSFA